MQNPCCSGTTPECVPEVQIIQGDPNDPNDPNVMKHVAGTYDTYKCTDCNIELSGCKRGDPGLKEHVLRAGKDSVDM